jgi:hypothetical protein
MGLEKLLDYGWQISAAALLYNELQVVACLRELSCGILNIEDYASQLKIDY